ncbi:hypothetical protein AGLY_007613 [Aphis glycines]|uniref:Uncharacterized protein n=1 Tax=Aphis glycines TaxID=307491 RepID=A0A6G0TMI7_APHGL|nr:hypothetical protein AGLY_007613 [Aphis glycines]
MDKTGSILTIAVLEFGNISFNILSFARFIGSSDMLGTIPSQTKLFKISKTLFPLCDNVTKYGSLVLKKVVKYRITDNRCSSSFDTFLKKQRKAIGFTLLSSFGRSLNSLYTKHHCNHEQQLNFQLLEASLMLNHIYLVLYRLIEHIHSFQCSTYTFHTSPLNDCEFLADNKVENSVLTSLISLFNISTMFLRFLSFLLSLLNTLLSAISPGLLVTWNKVDFVSVIHLKQLTIKSLGRGPRLLTN